MSIFLSQLQYEKLLSHFYPHYKKTSYHFTIHSSINNIYILITDRCSKKHRMAQINISSTDTELLSIHQLTADRPGQQQGPPGTPVSLCRED